MENLEGNMYVEDFLMVPIEEFLDEGVLKGCPISPMALLKEVCEIKFVAL